MLAMGWRGGLVVFFSVPLTFALTLLSWLHWTESHYLPGICGGDCRRW
jgi:hypothetical protein